MSVSSLLQQAVMLPTVQQHYKGSTSTNRDMTQNNSTTPNEISLIAIRMPLRLSVV